VRAHGDMDAVGLRRPVITTDAYAPITP